MNVSLTKRISTVTELTPIVKRRTKQREIEARKAEKASKAAAVAPSGPKKEKSGEELEGDLNPNVRSEKYLAL